MRKSISCLLNRFAILFALLFTIGVGQMWAGTKTVYVETTQCSTYDNVYIHYWNDGSGDQVATQITDYFWMASIPENAKWCVFRKVDGTGYNYLENVTNSDNFFYVVSFEQSKGNSHATTHLKTYDGSTYVYWRTNPANYNAWGDDNATLQIRLIRLDGDNLGFVNATDKDATSDHVARYLVPAGTYLRPELHTTKNNAYTGTFEFSSTASDNFIYNFTNNGGWANWATSYFSRSAYVYFDNTNSQWTYTYKEIMVGRDGTSDTYNMTLIPNTNNLYCYTSGLTYNDFTQFCFIGNSSHWGQYNDSPDNRKGSANTNTANYQVNMDHSSRQYNLFIPAGTTKGTSLTHTAYGDYTSLNYTQTVEQKLSENGGDSYSTSTRALATVSVNSYKMTSATGTTADGGSITSGQSSKSCDAARTATVTYSVSSVAEGYTFVGWYDGDTEKSTSTTYTYQATEAKTITARFKANSYTVVFNGNDKTSGSMSNQTFYYNVAQNLTTNAYGKNGYNFGGWTTNNDGTGSSYTNGQSVSNWSSTDGASITIYAKWTQNVTLDLESGTSGSTSVTATYNSATLGSYDNPERSGYTFGGYYSGDDGTGELIINTSKALQASKSVDEDVYTGAGGIWKHSSATTLYAKWTANNYTVTLENLGADEGHKGTENVSVTYDATTGLTSAITKPEKTHYDFGGYYTSEDGGETLGTQLIDANGNWKKSVSGYTGASGDYATWVYADNITLYAKWTEHEYTITTAVSPAGAGSISCGASTTAKYVTPSGDITATANAGWVFKEWQFSKTDETYDAYAADGYSSLINPVHINAVHDGTLTAVFEPRFSLVGSEYGSSNTKGMPGWEDYTKTFTVNSSDPVNLTCSRTLEASTTYKFQIHDCAESKNLGAGTDGQYVLLENASAVMANQDKDVKFTSTGAGTYIFHITAIDGSYHPTVEILWPHQTNFGRRRVDIDGTAHDDNTGGTLVVKAGESTISTGSWHTYGTNIAYDADNQTGYQLAWYNSSSYSETFSAGGEWNHDLTSNDNCYAQFSELATKVSLENDGHGKVQIGGVDKTETTCGITTSRTITAVPNTGYSFSGWTKPSGDDLNFTADAINPKTFTSKGGGLQSGQRIYANFTAKTYTVTLNNDQGGEGSDDGSATATYDATSLSDIIDAQFSGWTLLGYWNSSAVQVTDANGDLQANVDGYTDGSAKWTKDGDADLWAHWSRSVSLDREDGTTGSTSMTVIYKSSTLGSYSAPTKIGYNFTGYYTGDNGTGTMVINTSGVLQSNVTGYTNSDGQWTKEDATTLYAKWTPATLTFTGAMDSDWDDASNWSPAYLPTIEHDVVLNVPVEVNIDHATAKSIVLDQNGDNTGALTIQANKGLEVLQTIQVYDGSSYSATTPADLVLESSASGNATLIFDNSNSDQATVQMYSKGWTTGTQGSGTWNWQMIGTPVTDATRINDYYDGYMYKWSSGWVDMTDFSETLTPFAAYSATYPTTSDKLHTYSIDGTLVATGDKTIDVAASSVQAAANSWTAPIRINDITYTDWSPATIFLYNTGYNPKDGDAPEKAGSRYAAGTYLPVPVNSALYLDLGESYIAPMQGFFFKSASSGTITLNYANAVRTDGSKEIVAGEMHAPKRAMAAEPVVMKIYVSDSLYDDRVVLLARNDFSRGFDNGWDGEKFQVNAVTTAPRLFAINETGGKEEVSAIPELENTVIGFRPGTEETYTIHFDYNGDETLYLRDTRTSAETLITNESEYVFLSDGTNEDARFIISRVQSTPTGVEETGAGSKAYKLMIEDHIYIIRDGRMYSVDGALVNLERK